MAWDFETEPEFEAKLEWMREFVKQEIFPLETLAPEFRSAAGREALERYIEPRYLHQTMGRLPSGEILRSGDLTDELWDLEDQTAPWHKAVMWRIHFHVPVNAERMGPLETTRADLKTALQTVAQLDYAPHLEVETYTWEVLPGRQTTSLVDGLAQELNATSEMLQDIASGKK